MTYKKVIKTDLIYPELSYQIVGILFEVSNKLGFGFSEKYYQRAIAEILDNLKVPFKKEQKIEVALTGGKKIIVFADFLIGNKIILEIKKGERFLKSNIDQIASYLKAANLRLGILANFTKNGVQFKRILNS